VDGLSAPLLGGYGALEFVFLHRYVVFFDVDDG
jgi:hypothetical protein